MPRFARQKANGVGASSKLLHFGERNPLVSPLPIARHRLRVDQRVRHIFVFLGGEDRSKTMLFIAAKIQAPCLTVNSSRHFAGGALTQILRPKRSRKQIAQQEPSAHALRPATWTGISGRRTRGCASGSLGVAIQGRDRPRKCCRRLRGRLIRNRTSTLAAQLIGVGFKRLCGRRRFALALSAPMVVTFEAPGCGSARRLAACDANRRTFSAGNGRLLVDRRRRSTNGEVVFEAGGAGLFFVDQAPSFEDMLSGP